MKLLFFSITALSLLISIIANPTHPDSYERTSLSARAFLPEGPKPEPRPDPAHGDPLGVEQPKPIEQPKGTFTIQNIKTAIQNLPKQRWVRQWTNTIATKIDALKRLVGIRPGYRGKPYDLWETDDLGLPTGKPLDFTPKQISQLREVPYSGGTRFLLKGDKFETIEKNPKTGDRSGVYTYTETYVSPFWAVSTILEAMIARAKADAQDPGIVRVIGKRSSVLETVTDSQPNAAQDAAAVFQQYFGLFNSVQASIGALIAPILNNLTAQSNSTLIHQMALSIYYDLTGSTTVLVGPFNHGLNFLGNGSDTTDQGENIGNFSATAAVPQAIKSIYADMWAQSILALNSSGLYAQQLYLAECLYTNDTSVYPADFMSVTPGANKTSGS